MAEITAKIGTADWFSQAANKLLNLGLGVLTTELQGVQSTSASGTTPTTTSTLSSSMKYAPWILGGIAVVGIGIILWKR